METISVQKRDFAIKAKKMRHLGLVPGNVFGKALKESIPVQMEKAVARKIVTQMREGSKLTLDVDGQKLLVQIKEKSVDVLNNEIQHISFQVLTENEKVNSLIHILLKNEEKFGNLLEKMRMEIPYASLPGDMIDTITLDVDDKKTGDVIMIKDIPELMSEKIELQIPTDELVLRIIEKKSATNRAEEE